ncbi:uncharacterized protein DDB_G0284459-like [Bombus flavifrons]|uniref:uncharacterized protein DDB_G0284459-like n=1 Tax=Bombus flavifrons TaxID=103934 RepID=UPI0037039EF7
MKLKELIVAMNLALHGFLLQVLLSILNLQHGSLLCSAGEPGYLDFDNLPETNFSCQGKVIGGYYADVEAGCQMFHVCTIGQKDEIMDIKFLCLNGTVFDQETRVCERVDEVDCSKSERFYNLNLELYGNNAVTLSLHENSEDDVDPSDPVDDHQRSTSARPTTTTTTSTTTSKPSKPSTTPSSGSFSHPTGYPQHFQPQPPFPQVHTSQSKSLYDDKNSGYHHQYIFHNGERNNNQQATSYQLFSNQGVSSTTVQPPQVHQIRFSSTASPQIIHNEPSTASPLFHATSSTIQTLLNSNGNSPALINPIFHNHGIASTTEQFIHSNNPRETSDYRESGVQSIRPLEVVQSSNKGQVSKLTISPVPTPEPSRSVQTKTSSQSSQQPRISGNFLPTPSPDETTVRSFYPTPRTSSKPSQTSQSPNDQVTQHIHVLPPVQIPQLKPHQITINLPPPDLQRIVQNPSSLLPSQSRVIVTAKASVSDESGRPLNTTQLVTLPLPTIPASYDDYKEGDESFDPFYRDVPKIRNSRRISEESRGVSRSKRSVSQTKNSMVSFVYAGHSKRKRDGQVTGANKKDTENKSQDFTSIKESLMRFRDILFGEDFTEDTIRSVFEGSRLQGLGSDNEKNNSKRDSLEDLETKASKNFKARDYEEDDVKEKEDEETEDEETEDEEAEDEETEDEGTENEGTEDEGTEDDETKDEEKEDEESKTKQSDRLEIPLEIDTRESDAEEYIDADEEKDTMSNLKNVESDLEDIEVETHEAEKDEYVDSSDMKDKPNDEAKSDSKPKKPENTLDVVILDPGEYTKLKSKDEEEFLNTTEEEQVSTQTPILSSTEEITGATTEGDSVGKQDSKSTKDLDGTVQESKQSKLQESDSGKILEEEKKEEKPGIEPKPNMRRISSKIRARGKISSKRKETKIENNEPVGLLDDKVPDQKVETTTAIVNPEAEQIDKHIFNEPESQTSKDVDIRAVNNHGDNLKKLQTGKDHSTGKDNRKSEANEYETLEKQSRTLEKDEENVEILEGEEKATVPSLDEKEVEEKRKVEEEFDEEVEQPEAPKKDPFVEEMSYYKEESSIEHESMEDESTTVFSNEDSQDDQQEMAKHSRKGKITKFENFSKEVSSHRQAKSKKNENEKEEGKESREFSTMKNEETNSEEASIEHYDSTEAFYENTYEMSTDDEYNDPGSSENATISSEHVTSEHVASEEIPSSKEETLEEHEDDESVLSDQEESTEGVLKFTDELPKDKKEDVLETKRPSESVENIAHDYVDDNYEPDNYKEHGSSDSNSLSAEKIRKEMLADDKMEDIKKENEEDKPETTTEPQKDQDVETESPKESITEKIDLQTTTTTTTTSTTTSTSTTTTTARPMPPKLFKPITARKNYNYIPPTTTPNPVIIKPRLSLLNPKPAKPPKSYNELAPKPVIRKFTLLARKPTTTMPITTNMDENWTETVETMATDVSTTTTEASRSEENILESKLKPLNESEEKMHAPTKSKNDQDSSPSEQKSPTNVKQDQEENFTPYPVSRLSTLASTVEKSSKETESTSTEFEQSTSPKSFTLVDLEIVSTTTLPIGLTSIESDHAEESSSTTVRSTIEEETTLASSGKIMEQNLESKATEGPVTLTVSEAIAISETTTKRSETVESTTMRSLSRNSAMLRRQGGFNCLEKQMYRFYGDNRDCRLFHYCSPGFTSRQVLDFRFVCEEGTVFDEESQSCRHNARNKDCLKREWLKGESGF